MEIKHSIFTKHNVVSMESKPKQNNALSFDTINTTKLPNYNAAICILPSFGKGNTYGTKYALKKQSSSPLYRFNKENKFDSIPTNFANCFANIVILILH